jgi:hypothetical protein
VVENRQSRFLAAGINLRGEGLYYRQKHKSFATGEDSDNNGKNRHILLRKRGVEVKRQTSARTGISCSGKEVSR